MRASAAGSASIRDSTSADDMTVEAGLIASNDGEDEAPKG
jgi:hypothetical protein